MLTFIKVLHKLSMLLLKSRLIYFILNKFIVKFYSASRVRFMNRFVQLNKIPVYNPNKEWERNLWGLTFRSPIMNSAGMFKNGEGYNLISAIGAGGYIGGTSTANPRKGNSISGITLPFITLHKSHTSVNSLGLPNLGDIVLSKVKFTKLDSCPVGWSLMRSPDYSTEEGLDELIKSLWLYHDNPQIDFLEINESCPNIKLSAGNINQRLEYIAKNFLSLRKRHLPVVVKLSNDTTTPILHTILDTLFKYKYDGINLGNTSTDYENIKNHIDESEIRLFDYFTTNYKGGVGGAILKEKSLQLCKEAIKYRDIYNKSYEFHVIRSGGIDSFEDILQSDAIGVSMNQWYTGFFTNYINHGNNIYQNFLKNYKI